jgi:hypothetical protein
MMAEHSPFPWTLDIGVDQRPYVRDANGTIILKFYRDSIARPIPWEANVATVLAAVVRHRVDRAMSDKAPMVEEIEAILNAHCYPFSDIGIGGIPEAATAILAALTQAHGGEK